MFRFPQRIQSTIYNLQSISSGFSLIELLVTFTLITIISGIGFASFVSYSRRQIVNQAAGDIKQTVDLARFNALSSVKPSLCSTTDQLSSYKVNFCLNALCQTANVDYEMVVFCGAESVVRSGKFPQNVTVANVVGSNSCATIAFNILTSITEGVPCEIYVEGYGNQLKVSIDSIGNASY